MIFEDRGQYLAIANAKEVDSVIMAGRKFIPGDKKFYEWVAGTNIRLYADFVCTIEEEGALQDMELIPIPQLPMP